MSASPKSLIRLRHVGTAALLMLAGCAAQQLAQAPAGPIPQGQARIWFYRDYEPSVTMNNANIDLNGVRVLTLPAYGPALYRDVAPGSYLIAAESVGTDVNQNATMTLRPGQEIFAKVLDNPAWISGDDVAERHRDTYFIRLMAPDVARAQIAAGM
jgi:hypothetical protein